MSSEAHSDEASPGDLVMGAARLPRPRRVLPRLALLTERVIATVPGVSILTYHGVGPLPASELDVELEAFRAQLALIHGHHRVITLDEAIRGLSREDRSVDGSVVLTFDDATADVLDVVLPELFDRHLPATVYVASSVPTSWAGLRDALTTGLITIGSHGHVRFALDRTTTREAADDLDRSIELIAAHLGDAPIHFAYPTGRPGKAPVDALVKERFRSAALGGGRINRIGRTDLHRLWRTRIEHDDSLDLFAHKVRNGLRFERSLRWMRHSSRS